MLVRFEKENGGELLVGALCLLEVSQGGLLEAELLAILGDEEDLMPDSNKDKDKGGEKGNILHYNSYKTVEKDKRITGI